LTVFDQSAAMIARDRGAQYLLAETIQRWNQMRTDDPVGALMTPRNSIGISVRLIRLEPPAVIGSITFTNRSRITLNQDAAHLLNRDFDAALRALLWNQKSSK
jgi:hypothetical protein